MNRRNFLKSSMFGSAVALITQIPNINSVIESDDNEINYNSPKKSTSHGLFVISYGELYGSKKFPIRPVNTVVSDGQLIWFVFPSEKGKARGYIKQYDNSPLESPDMIVHRIRMSKPEPPYYLYWRSGDYYVYKTPGSLVKRASYLLHNKQENEYILQAISDFRFASLINLAFCDPGQSEEIMLEIVELDNSIRQSYSKEIDFDYFLKEYKKLLTMSKNEMD